MKVPRLFGVLALTLASAACGDDAESPTSPTAVTFMTDQFAGVLEPGERKFYSFTLDTAGPVVVTLASVTSADSGVPVPIALRVGVGRPQGTECPPASAATVPAALTSQLTHLATDGIYCIDVGEVGAATAPVRFAVRFTHP